MKKDLHPTYYENAKVTCACGASFAVGSTKEKISTEICSNCHPFYTGTEKLLDVAGKVERFKSRQVKAAHVVATPKKTERRRAAKAKKIAVVKAGGIPGARVQRTK